jgi:hypothetical protein
MVNLTLLMSQLKGDSLSPNTPRLGLMVADLLYKLLQGEVFRRVRSLMLIDAY